MAPNRDAAPGRSGLRRSPLDTVRAGPVPDRPTWVFGYGSLIWKQDFPFLDARPGRIRGWQRRFWQGSHDHRGVVEDPGRVVTLVPAPGAVCEGRAFLVEPAVFEHLDHREKNGYERIAVDILFGAHGGNEAERGVVYRATEANPAYLGPAPPAEIAAQIGRCAGPSGSNRDYLFELARALRALGVSDPHVFELEQQVRRIDPNAPQQPGER